MLHTILNTFWLRFPLALLLARLVVVPLSLWVHELAHAAAALLLGDPTPRESGRLSINPLKGMAGLGTIGGVLVGVGWSNPMPIRPHRMRVPGRLGGLLAVLAGPLATAGLVLAGQGLLSALALKPTDPWGGLPTLADFLTVLVRFNLVLALINVLPLYPLDAYQVLRVVLPLRAVARWERIGGTTQFVLGSGLLALLMLPGWVLSAVLGPAVMLARRVFLGW